MRKLDLIVGIVGGVVLVAALAGAYREGSSVTGSAPNAFSLSWGTKTTDLAGVQTTAFPFETTVAITASNLTEVNFDVVFSAAQTYLSLQGDALTVTVTPPAGSGLNASTVTGTLTTTARATTLTIPFQGINTVPPVTAAQGADEAAALAALRAANTTTRGVGNWTVKVEMTRSVSQSGAVTAEVSGTFSSYEATVKRDPAPAPQP